MVARTREGWARTSQVLAPLVAVMSFIVLLCFARYHGGESEDIFMTARMSFREGKLV